MKRRIPPRTTVVPAAQGLPTGQCDHFRPPARPLDSWFPKGELGSRSWMFHRRGVAAASRTVGRRPRPDASNACQIPARRSRAAVCGFGRVVDTRNRDVAHG